MEKFLHALKQITGFQSCLMLSAAVTLILAISAAGPLQAGQTYVVGVEAIDYFPAYDGASAEYRGCGRAIMDLFAAENDITFVYKAFPVKRLFAEYLNTQALDFKFPDNPLWSKKDKQGKSVSYSNPMYRYIDGVMVKPENRDMPLEQLKNMGIIAGFTAWEYLELTHSGQIALDEVNNYAALLKKTVMGRTQACYSNVAVAKYNLRETINQPDALVFAKALPHTKSSYQLSTRKHADVIAGFNKWMKENAAVVQQIISDYKAEAGVY